jgi:hypothetical protein
MSTYIAQPAQKSNHQRNCGLQISDCGFPKQAGSFSIRNPHSAIGLLSGL